MRECAIEIFLFISNNLSFIESTQCYLSHFDRNKEKKPTKCFSRQNNSVRMYHILKCLFHDHIWIGKQSFCMRVNSASRSKKYYKHDVYVSSYALLLLILPLTTNWMLMFFRVMFFSAKFMSAACIGWHAFCCVDVDSFRICMNIHSLIFKDNQQNLWRSDNGVHKVNDNKHKYIWRDSLWNHFMMSPL